MEISERPQDLPKGETHNTGKEESKFRHSSHDYTSNVKSSSSSSSSNIVRRSYSLKSKIDKVTYLQLHRQSSSNGSVDKLKGKYESIAQQSSHSDAKSSITAGHEKANTDKVSPKDKQNTRDDRANSAVDESGNFQTEDVNVSVTSLLIESSTSKREEKQQDDASVSKDYLRKTQSNIEQLQNHLTNRLSSETIEKLKHRYSPASFGYSGSTLTGLKANKTAIQEAPSKIPVPSPRASIKSSNDSEKESKLDANLAKEVKVEAVTVKLGSLPEKAESVRSSLKDADAKKDENSNLVTEGAVSPTIPKAKEKQQEERPQSATYKNFDLISPAKELSDGDLRKLYGDIKFAEPEDQHLIVRRSSSEDSLSQVEHFLSEIVMEKQPKEKKRSNSFRKIAAGIFGRDKKSKSGGGGGSSSDKSSSKHKKDNGSFSSQNAQNESQAFDRNTSHRHTVDNSYMRHQDDRRRNAAYQESNGRPAALHHPQYRSTLDSGSNVRGRYTEMGGSNGAPSFRSNRPQLHPGEDYVPMDNFNAPQGRNVQNPYMNVNNYADTSSSSNTIDSESRNCTYQNALIAQAEMRHQRNYDNRQGLRVHNSFSRDVPDNFNARNFASNQREETKNRNLQLVKPKAVIPINSERPLPNPYHNNTASEKYENSENSKTIDRNLNVEYPKPTPSKNYLHGSVEKNTTNKGVIVEDMYGTVFDSIASPPSQGSLPKMESPHASGGSIVSPTSPKTSLESSKLRLPSNREKIELQPRIRSPIPQVKVSTDKIIATSLLRNKKSSSSRESPAFIDDLNSLRSSSPQVHDSPSSSPLSPNSRRNQRDNSLDRYANNRLNQSFNQSRLSPGLSTSSPSNSSLQNLSNESSNVHANMANLSIDSTTKSSSNEASQLDPIECLRAGEWHRQVKELANFGPLENASFTTNVMVHVDPEGSRMGSSRSSSPLVIRDRSQRFSYNSLEKPPSVRNSNASLTNLRSHTPTQQQQIRPPSSASPRSPEKQEIINNVEAFYWRQLKKLKNQEDQELSMYRQRQYEMYGYVEEPVVSSTRRSRSESPGMRGTQRSLSLPRDDRIGVSSSGRFVRPYIGKDGIYSGKRMVNGHEAIPEGRPVIAKQPIVLPGAESGYGEINRILHQSPQGNRNQHFVRNAFERSTIGPIGTARMSRDTNEIYSPGNRQQQQHQQYAPIFKRGSLTGSINAPDYQLSKRVSFSNTLNPNDPRSWPTKNGFTASPPTRRVDRETSMEDEVFLPTSPNQDRQAKMYNENNTNQDISGPPPTTNQPPRGMEDLYGRALAQKQITMSNKVCDIYGKIHDQHPQQNRNNQRILAASKNYGEVKQVGTVYGKLQGQDQHTYGGLSGASPALGHSHNQLISSPNPSFVRGTRLTASANDMYRRYQLEDAAAYYQAQRRTQGVANSAYSNVEKVMMIEPPNRPLPPIPQKHQLNQRDSPRVPFIARKTRGPNFESVDAHMVYAPGLRQNINVIEEEWNSDGKLGRGSGNESGGSRGGDDGEVKTSRSRSARRDDPRRHTLSGDQHYGMAGQGGPLSRTMDLEGQFTRGYPPSSNAMLFDDDPGIMSEVETSSTGFRRGGKQRSSLPVVRTPSKTLERPLGLVFLQYRNETKRALLPNEITSIDTVKALFVRSFPKQLSMEYLDSPLVKIYIHDSSKDMFYELEDVRSHLREIRDRSVLRLFESTDVSGGLPMVGVGIPGGVGHFEDPSYFSEPEFDSEYQHQHIHKSKGTTGKSAPYYMGSTSSLPRGGPLLRPYSPAVSNIPPDRMKTLPGDGYMSSPERGSRSYEDPYYSQYASRSGSITPVIDEEISDTELLDEQYSLYGVKIAPGGPRNVRAQFPGPAAPPYDTTRLRVEHMERQLANLTGLVQKALTQTPPQRDFLAPPGRDAYRSDKSVSFEKSVSFSDEPPDMNSPKQHSPQHAEKDRLKPAPPPKPASLSPGQYEGRHIYRDLQLTPEMYNQLRGLQKKAKDLKAEVRNLRRMSQAQAHSVRETIRDTFIKIRAMLVAGGEQVWQAGMDQERVRLSRDEDLYKQEMLRLEKDLTDLEGSVEELRGNVINRKTRVNMSDVENMALILSKSSKTVADLKLRFPGLQDSMKAFLSSEMDKVVREEKFLKEEPERLESALRRCKKLTGTLVTLKRLASVQEQRLPCATGTPDGRISPTVSETPPVTPTTGQHSKSSSGTHVGQVNFGGDTSNGTDSSQRPENALDALLDELQTFSKPHPVTVNTQMPQTSYSDSTPSDPPAIPVKGIPPSHSTHFGHPHMSEIGRKGSMDSASILPTQNLMVSTTTGSLRRLHSYPSGSDTDNSPPIQPPRNQLDSKIYNKPPIPERNAELLQHINSGRRVPPPPPPRTSSKSPLASPTSPSLPPRSPATGLQHIQNVQTMSNTEKPQSQFEAATQNLGLSTLRRNVPNRSSLKDNKSQTLPRNIGSNLQVHTQVVPIGNELQNVSSSSCESVNSQDGTKKGSRKEELEHRHQELLKKQKALQEQYARLQQLQRGNNTLVAVIPPAPDQLLKKTGSESNLLQKMGLQLTTTQMTGSLTNLPSTTTNSTNTVTNVSTTQPPNTVTSDANVTDNSSSSNITTTSKVYETDIL